MLEATLHQGIAPRVLQDYLTRHFPLVLPGYGSIQAGPGNLFIAYSDQPWALSFTNARRRFPEQCGFSKPFCMAGRPVTAFYFAGDLFTWGDFYQFVQDQREASLRAVLTEAIQAQQEGENATFKVGERTWKADAGPLVMGVLNLTPDSFYDGGRYLKPEDWQAQIVTMVAEGVDIIDLGGESTRPGSQAVPASEQTARVLPAVQWIKERYELPISIDTALPEVARPCLQAGAEIINDVSGLAMEAEMLDLVNQFNASYVLMHRQGIPETMQQAPIYENCLLEVGDFLAQRQASCMAKGIEKNRLLLDPGIGFGKLPEHNLDLLNFLQGFRSLGSQIMLGTSHKSFIGELLDLEKDQRSNATLATSVMGLVAGAKIFRVHEVGATKEALNMTRYYL